MYTLKQAAAAKPYPEYRSWWSMGTDFTRMMRTAITTSWREICTLEVSDAVRQYLTEYMLLVYGRDAPASLVDSFFDPEFSGPLQSGEFDALSYAFFRSAFEQIKNNGRKDSLRDFTRTVGQRFFEKLAAHLDLRFPSDLRDIDHLAALQLCIDRTGNFLVEQGYLRDSFSFSFEIDLPGTAVNIFQSGSQVPAILRSGGTAYALYRMSYPAILPSAVYLYHTLGEAQHHSSRTIEELFARAGCAACESVDFDPASHSADEVVELWEIRENRFEAAG